MLVKARVTEILLPTITPRLVQLRPEKQVSFTHSQHPFCLSSLVKATVRLWRRQAECLSFEGLDALQGRQEISIMNSKFHDRDKPSLKASWRR